MIEIKFLVALASYTASQIAQLRLILRKAKHTLSFNTTQNWDLEDGLYQVLTVTNNFTLNFPSNVTEGETAFIYVSQDGTGSRVITFGSGFKAPGGIGSIVLSTAPSTVDRLEFFFNTSTTATVTIAKGIS